MLGVAILIFKPLTRSRDPQFTEPSSEDCFEQSQVAKENYMA